MGDIFMYVFLLFRYRGTSASVPIFTEIFLFSSVKCFGPCCMSPYFCWLRRGPITVQTSVSQKCRKHYRLYSFLCNIICFVCLRPVSYVPNVVSVSGLSILDCPFGFLKRLFTEGLRFPPPIKLTAIE